jgi:U1 small nuclear ribonucleoprotein C
MFKIITQVLKLIDKDLDAYKVQSIINNITKAYVYAGLGGFPELPTPGQKPMKQPSRMPGFPPGFVQPPGMPGMPPGFPVGPNGMPMMPPPGFPVGLNGMPMMPPPGFPGMQVPPPPPKK